MKYTKVYLSSATKKKRVSRIIGGGLRQFSIIICKKVESKGKTTYNEVDLNRAGVPLLEIVSEPDMRTGIEAAEYAVELQRLVRFLGVADFFDATIAKGADVKLAANWIMGDIAAYMKNEKLSVNEIKLTPQELAELIASIKGGTINGKIGKEILFELMSNGGTVKRLITEKDLVQEYWPACSLK
ncbi:hypothetical protein LOK49_LG08G00620 [Camellia lanceoleosa]|uniref:Uncharacterized protein n=1 Tax=Camellia lanceoleosa TaxID=1840588 RepID=A0ACC0GST5_9ERIC|nr:hypothetical protein LOK49_LG08G00620 [Camellia lanceoleosa]